MEDWLPEQRQRLETWDVSRCVDVHCHCLAGLDDGPESIDQAVALCRALAADGITTVIATPHQLGSYDRVNSAQVIRTAVAELTKALAERHIPLEVMPGGDVRIDERLERLLEAGEVSTLADAGKHLLIELPHGLFVDPMSTFTLLIERGIQPIMTHPERYRYLRGSNERPREWVAVGAVLQVTAGSLIGDFGSRPADHAWRLVEEGLVSLLATDAHDPHYRPPALTAALAMLTDQFGTETARQIAIDNPLRVLQGVTIEPPIA